MTRWIEIARKYEGLAEVKGPQAHPVILGWLHGPGKGKSWVKDDATPWCGAAMAGIFTEAGLAGVLPAQPLRARAWETAGVALDGPKVGAIVVIPRGTNPAQGHVGLLVDWSDTHLTILGGNQADKFCTARFKRPARAVYRWPVPIKTPAEIEAEGSRIARAARRQQRDTAAAGGVSASPAALPPVPAPPVTAAPDAAAVYGPPAPLPPLSDQVQAIPEQLAGLKAVGASVVDFAAFAGVKWPLIALALGLYFAARIAWDGYRIRAWRTQDANEGWSA